MLLKRIKGFENYWCSLEGDIWSDKTKRFLKPGFDKLTGYYKVSLYVNKKNFNKSIHRILCETFKKNPNKYPYVDHVNMNKQDNKLENLRWVSFQTSNHNKKNHNKYLNIQVTKNGNFIVEFKYKQVRRTFQDLKIAKQFRDIIQNKIDNNEIIDRVFVELYHNEMKHIFKNKNKTYKLQISKPNLKHNKTYKTLEEVINKRNELLQEYYK
jgi:ACT domain-containing protein